MMIVFIDHVFEIYQPLNNSRTTLFLAIFTTEKLSREKLFEGLHQCIVCKRLLFFALNRLQLQPIRLLLFRNGIRRTSSVLLNSLLSLISVFVEHMLGKLDNIKHFS